MIALMDYPLLVFVASLLMMSAAAIIGLALSRARHVALERSHDMLNVVQAATLTLLGLIIGFTFSMAVSRYDQRKNYEEAEANAIGTEYLRIDLLNDSDQSALRTHLVEYLENRIRYYGARPADDLGGILKTQGQLEAALWSDVARSAKGQPDQIRALAVAGMNDVINSEGYTQAALWNRIPTAAWALMLIIGACCNLLLGLGDTNVRAMPGLLLILPFFVAISFMLIADIDSPRGGLIRVVPQNLHALADSLHHE